MHHDFMLKVSASSCTVLQCLSAVLLARRQPVVSPFGVVLQPVLGHYAAGQRVLSPGIDKCMPAVVAEVVAVGTRTDQGGTWYLLRNLSDNAPSALLREDMLQTLSDDLK